MKLAQMLCELLTQEMARALNDKAFSSLHLLYALRSIFLVVCSLPCEPNALGQQLGPAKLLLKITKEGVKSGFPPLTALCEHSQTKALSAMDFFW